MSLLKPIKKRKSRRKAEGQIDVEPDPAKQRKRRKSVRRAPENTSDDDRSLAEITSGIGSGRSLNARIEEKFGIPLCFLTEKQWEQVREVSDLPIYARFEINIALRRYWEKRLEKAVDRAKIKRRIRDAIEKVEELISGLSSIALDEDFTKGSIVYFDRSPGAARNPRIHLRVSR